MSSLRSDVPFTPEDRAELLETAEESLDRLRALVENLLDMSRLEAGALPLALQAIDAADVVAAAVATVGPAAQAVAIHVPDDLPDVVADPALLERAVANLVAELAALWCGGRGALGHGGRAGAGASSCAWSTPVRACRARTGTGSSCRSSGSATAMRGSGVGPRARALPRSRRGHGRHPRPRGHTWRWAHHGHQPSLWLPPPDVGWAPVAGRMYAAAPEASR